MCWSNRLGRRGPERLDESFGFDRGIGQGRPWIDRSLDVKPRPWSRHSVNRGGGKGIDPLEANGVAGVDVAVGVGVWVW